MSERVHYYFGAILGAYLTFWLGIEWWSPLVWLGGFVLIEVIVALIDRHAKRRAEDDADDN